jgi:Kef-type K+ transport system membrane component KefB
VLADVLLALVAVIALGSLLARLFRRLGQPPVIGEVVAGLLLGPSLIGPALSARIIAPAALPVLEVIAGLGVSLFMFLVGVELDLGLLRRQAPAAVAISQASIVLPFGLGAALALGLYPGLAGEAVPLGHFALFLGVAMAVTAFPVLARILRDGGLAGTALGTLALGAAAVGDATAWGLLALVVALTQADVGRMLPMLLGLAAFLGLVAAVGPALGRWAGRWQGERLRLETLAGVLALALVAALATERLGLHALFGAFVVGLVIPAGSDMAHALTRQAEAVVATVLLPAFFALTGVRTDLDLLSGPGDWLTCLLIVAVATAGKFGGAYGAGRLTGLGHREAAILGTLMNTRGLVELIVLNVGLHLGILSPRLFAMMVMMALVTTLATGPIVQRLMQPAASPQPA